MDLDKIGFRNVGHWREVQGSVELAQINLIETLVGFFTNHVGSVLDVACGRGASTNFLLLNVDVGGERTFAGLLRLVSREFFSAIQRLDIGKTMDAGRPERMSELFVQWFPSSPMTSEAMVPAGSEWDADQRRLEVRSLSGSRGNRRKGTEYWRFKLSFAFWNTADGIAGGVGYRADLLSAQSLAKAAEDSGVDRRARRV